MADAAFKSSVTFQSDHSSATASTVLPSFDFAASPHRWNMVDQTKQLAAVPPDTSAATPAPPSFQLAPQQDPGPPQWCPICRSTHHSGFHRPPATMNASDVMAALLSMRHERPLPRMARSGLPAPYTGGNGVSSRSVPNSTPAPLPLQATTHIRTSTPDSTVPFNRSFTLPPLLASASPPRETSRPEAASPPAPASSRRHLRHLLPATERSASGAAALMASMPMVLPTAVPVRALLSTKGEPAVAAAHRHSVPAPAATRTPAAPTSARAPATAAVVRARIGGMASEFMSHSARGRGTIADMPLYSRAPEHSSAGCGVPAIDSGGGSGLSKERPGNTEHTGELPRAPASPLRAATITLNDSLTNQLSARPPPVRAAAPPCTHARHVPPLTLPLSPPTNEHSEAYVIAASSLRAALVRITIDSLPPRPPPEPPLARARPRYHHTRGHANASAGAPKVNAHTSCTNDARASIDMTSVPSATSAAPVQPLPPPPPPPPGPAVPATLSSGQLDPFSHSCVPRPVPMLLASVTPDLLPSTAGVITSASDGSAQNLSMSPRSEPSPAPWVATAATTRSPGAAAQAAVTAHAIGPPVVAQMNLTPSPPPPPASPQASVATSFQASTATVAARVHTVSLSPPPPPPPPLSPRLPASLPSSRRSAPRATNSDPLPPSAPIAAEAAVVGMGAAAPHSIFAAPVVICAPFAEGPEPPPPPLPRGFHGTRSARPTWAPPSISRTRLAASATVPPQVHGLGITIGTLAEPKSESATAVVADRQGNACDGHQSPQHFTDNAEAASEAQNAKNAQCGTAAQLAGSAAAVASPPCAKATTAFAEAGQAHEGSGFATYGAAAPVLVEAVGAPVDTPGPPPTCVRSGTLSGATSGAEMGGVQPIPGGPLAYAFASAGASRCSPQHAKQQPSLPSRPVDESKIAGERDSRGVSSGEGVSHTPQVSASPTQPRATELCQSAPPACDTSKIEIAAAGPAGAKPVSAQTNVGSSSAPLRPAHVRVPLVLAVAAPTAPAPSSPPPTHRASQPASFGATARRRRASAGPAAPALSDHLLTAACTEPPASGGTAGADQGKRDDGSGSLAHQTAGAASQRIGVQEQVDLPSFRSSVVPASLPPAHYLFRFRGSLPGTTVPATASKNNGEQLPRLVSLSTRRGTPGWANTIAAAAASVGAIGGTPIQVVEALTSLAGGGSTGDTPQGRLGSSNIGNSSGGDMWQRPLPLSPDATSAPRNPSVAVDYAPAPSIPAASGMTFVQPAQRSLLSPRRRSSVPQPLSTLRHIDLTADSVASAENSAVANIITQQRCTGGEADTAESERTGATASTAAAAVSRQGSTASLTIWSPWPGAAVSSSSSSSSASASESPGNVTASTSGLQAVPAVAPLPLPVLPPEPFTRRSTIPARLAARAHLASAEGSVFAAASPPTTPTTPGLHDGTGRRRPLLPIQNTLPPPAPVSPTVVGVTGNSVGPAARATLAIF